MRVITYNLHKARRSGRSILDEAAAALRERSPDLLLCQEVFHTHCDTERQAVILGQHLGLEHAFGPNKFYEAGCHGNATFTRLPVLRAFNIDVTESRFEHRGILHTHLEWNDSVLEILNTHFSLTGRQRRKQLETLLDAIPDGDVPVLVAGDFNDWHGFLDRRIDRERHLRSALDVLSPTARRTFPARRPFLALDRIYYRGLELDDVRVLRGDPWDVLSDHLPLEADFRVHGSAVGGA
ncbi:MAG: endonuclease/exonuclease/phosphatase family protein [Planctomycetes bacterium]|nr:endonuclease/exonuclease/phosphatase family protein [Planctomycetota bacterium]MCB9891106.1 endonuclease/exonuclease/phosphatase family protein [Planctomycetota bacterium]MCB9918874.1 endonuclease/exonuclease/phosphatase family protein [Planctomycetota bacterium]